ncbi:MAG: xanthine dehydrogenase family protein molybdopterin-binding subunit [Alphaproteobacteria bacterium]|nr:xanthine dehydrogenase family protein molybdopterin-binding subunit [Alphaproteobacteria bacterium]
MTNLDITRRAFVVTTAAAGGGMMLGFYMGGRSAHAANNINPKPWERVSEKDGQEVNAWLVIDPDGTTTIRVGQSEMGQGVFTAMPMLVAEELHVDWKMVKAEYADSNRHVRNNNLYQRMSTGGSGAVRNSRVYLQQAGASARERLKEAAAQAWSVPRDQVAAKDSVLTSGTRRGTYAEFATKAASIQLAKEPDIKQSGQFTLLGTRVARLDTPLKVNGAAIFGIDVRLPGMVYAAVKSVPVRGGSLKSFNFDAIKGRPGIVGAYALKPVADQPFASRVPAGVAVVADTYYRALTALNLMPVEWDLGPDANISTTEYYKQLAEAVKVPGAVARNDGDTIAVMKTAAKTVEGTYRTGYQAHTCMEPLNCTVSITADRVDVWGGFQNPPGSLAIVAEHLGVQPVNVYTHTTFLGDGFGQRSRNHEVRQAAEVARLVGNRPVKMIWTREEDTRMHTGRPASYSWNKAGLDAAGNIIAIHSRTAGHSAAAQNNPTSVANGLDNGISNGIRDHRYKVANSLAENYIRNTNQHTAAYRAPGYEHNLFHFEQFMDEIALAAGKNPLDMRIALTTDLPDWQMVLKTLKQKSGYRTDLPKGEGMGVAICESFGTIVAAAAKVTVSRRGQLTVDKVNIVLDCGNLVTPAIAEHQGQSAVVYALTDMLYRDMTIEKGAIVESNFDTYPLMKINQMPVVETHFALSGGDKWGGMGEPVTPPVAPAAANAIFAATGIRVRTQPILGTSLAWT